MVVILWHHVVLILYQPMGMCVLGSGCVCVCVCGGGGVDERLLYIVIYDLGLTNVG